MRERKPTMLEGFTPYKKASNTPKQVNTHP